MNAKRRTRTQLQPVTLRPHDICVGLQLVLTPEVSFRELSAGVGLSLGEAHNSTRRLEVAHIVMSHRRAVNVRPFLEFLVHGVPDAFPGELGPETQGVPTALSGPALHDQIVSFDVVVWPSLEGKERGSALAPLCKEAPSMRRTNPALYRWLTVVDALRIGRSRERRIAGQLLTDEVRSRSDAHE